MITKRAGATRRRRAAVRHVALTSLVLVACGSRTGLFADEEPSDLTVPGDGGALDARARFDASGFVDGQPPPIDAAPPPVDVYRADCPESDALLVYTIADDNRLQAFNPAAGTFRDVGRISCPAGDANPFSMAVDRKGTAYVLFTDDKIYQVSTATGACVATPYVSGQSNFRKFGMGFVTIAGGPAERLYVAGDGRNGALSGRGIATIDPTTFRLSFVGADPRFESAELTGTGDGRLFAFYRTDPDSDDSFIGEVDQDTGFIKSERYLPTVDQGRGWAFAFWGGDFYMFHAPNGLSSLVTRWRPADDTVVTIASAPGDTIIVGAGVSTCAPQ